MESLSHGIDPTSNIEFPDDTILNSNILKLYFSEAAELFALLEANIDKVSHLKLGNAVSRKIPFHLDPNEIKNIRLSDEPITISRFVFLINETCHHQDMKKLKATQITAWLVAHDYAEIHRPRRHRAQMSRRSASVSLSEKMPGCGPQTIFSRTHSVFSRKTARSKSV